MPTMSTSSVAPQRRDTTPYRQWKTAHGGEKGGGSARLPLGMKRQSMLVSASRGEQLAKNRSPPPKTRHPSGPAVGFGDGDKGLEIGDPVGRVWVHSREEWRRRHAPRGWEGMITGVNGLPCFCHVFFFKYHFLAFFFQVRGLGPREDRRRPDVAAMFLELTRDVISHAVERFCRVGDQESWTRSHCRDKDRLSEAHWHGHGNRHLHNSISSGEA